MKFIFVLTILLSHLSAYALDCRLKQTDPLPNSNNTKTSGCSSTCRLMEASHPGAIAYSAGEPKCLAHPTPRDPLSWRYYKRPIIGRDDCLFYEKWARDPNCIETADLKDYEACPAGQMIVSDWGANGLDLCVTRPSCPAGTSPAPDYQKKVIACQCPNGKEPKKLPNGQYLMVLGKAVCL